MKYLLTSFLCTLLAPSLSADVYDDIQPGEWKQVSLNTLQDVDPADDPAINLNHPNRPTWSGKEGLSGVFNDWTGGAFSPAWGNLGGLFAWGGGHQGYYGGEVYVFDIERRRWERLTDPVHGQVCDDVTGQTQDGAPCASHSEDSLEYHPPSNSFVVLSSEINNLGGYYTSRVHLLDLDTLTWTLKNVVNEGKNARTSIYDPSRDLFWSLGIGVVKLSSFDPDGNSNKGEWTTHGSSFATPSSMISEYDPVRDLMIVHNRIDDELWAFDLGNPDKQKIILNSQGDLECLEYTRPAIVWNPDEALFVVWGNTLGTIPATDVCTVAPPPGDWRKEPWIWTRIPASPATATPGINHNGVYSKFRYVPSKKVFVVGTNYYGDVYAYRLGKR